MDVLREKMTEAFEAAGYDKKDGFISVSNRPDLCQYQCNGAMAAAKEYKKAPFMIAGDVVEKLAGDESEYSAVKSGSAGTKCFRWI